MDKIGDVLVSRNDLSGALSRYEERPVEGRQERRASSTTAMFSIPMIFPERFRVRGGLEIARRLMAADPSHAEHARDVFVSLARLGMARGQAGDAGAACAAFAEAKAIVEPLARAAPDHHQRQQDLAWIVQRMEEFGCKG